MRLPSLSVVRPGGAVALAIAMLLSAGCAKLPFMGKSSLHVTLTAAKDCNSCGKPNGYPLTYRVLQVTDASAITGATLTQFWDREDKLLGAALLKKSESHIDPGGKAELAVDKAPGVTAMIVEGNFCKTSGSCWYYVQPLAKGGSVKLVAGSTCITVAK